MDPSTISRLSLSILKVVISSAQDKELGRMLGMGQTNDFHHSNFIIYFDFYCYI